MNNSVFGKTMGNVRKHRDIKLVTTKRRRNYLVSEPNYHITKFFTEQKKAERKKRSAIKNSNDRQNTSSSSVRSRNTFSKNINKHSITSAK